MENLWAENKNIINSTDGIVNVMKKQISDLENYSNGVVKGKFGKIKYLTDITSTIEMFSKMMEQKSSIENVNNDDIDICF